MTSYDLEPDITLREVYLTYLIALDNEEFLELNGLVADQVMAFRTIGHITWGEFVKAKNESKGDE